MSTILHIEDAQRLQRNPDRAYKPDIIDKYSRYSSGVYAPMQREGRFPDTCPADQRIDTRPYQPSTYSELLELEASLPQRQLLAKVPVRCLLCCALRQLVAKGPVHRMLCSAQIQMVAKDLVHSLLCSAHKQMVAKGPMHCLLCCLLYYVLLAESKRVQSQDCLWVQTNPAC